MVKVIDKTDDLRRTMEERKKYLEVARKTLGDNYEVHEVPLSIVVRDTKKPRDNNDRIVMHIYSSSSEVTVYGPEYIDDAIKIAEACERAKGSGIEFTVRKRWARPKT